MDFEQLQLIEPIRRALSEQGYTQPTAIQAGAIPPALEGRDVLGSARTGTGKTCAFAVPILQRLTQHPVTGRQGKPPIRALVLTPTRELAIQNQEQVEHYGKYLPLKSVVIYGGVGQKPQVDAIQAGAEILIATPGRLADLYGQGLLDLSQLEIFVLDEADRMLDMGFIHDVRKILKWLPEKKQTLFFSATMPDEIMDLVNRLLDHPARVAVDPVSSPVEVIQQSAWPVDRENKTKLMVWILEQKHISSALVFTRTKHGADKVSRDLNRAGVSAAAIHGNKSQTARQTALANFKSGKIRVLVATDIAARGLDIQDMPCVFNYNLPEVPETYIHRIGRTGRAGHDGMAFTLYDYGEQPLLKEVEKLMGKQVPKQEDHPWPMQRFEAPVRDKRGKIVNPEDMESRKAAREKRNARKAEVAKANTETAPVLEPSVSTKKKTKKKEQVKPALTPTKAVSATEPEEPAVQWMEPAAPVWSEEGEIPYYSLDLLPPRTEQMLDNSTPFDSKDILTRKYKRPARRVVPSLSRVSLLPGGELKETFSSRLRLEDSEPVLTQGKDATDRLLARKKPERRRKKGAEPSGKEKEAAKNKQPTQPEKAAAVSGEQKPKNSRKRRNRKKPSGNSVKPAVAAPALKAKEPKASNAPKAKPAAAQKAGGKGQQSKPNAPKRAKQPRAPQPISHSRQKDSTEQSSLMKPYYLSDLKKR